MRKKRLLKRVSKGFVSVLLALSVMLSLVVPFNITVFAAEAAEGTEICAYLRYIDPSKSGDNKKSKNIELVFARKENKPVDAISSYESISSTDFDYNFAEKEYITTSYAFDGNGRVGTTYYYTYKANNSITDADRRVDAWAAPDLNKVNFTPWYMDPLTEKNLNIRKITFKDKIAPKYTAGWFLRCTNLTKVEGISNLDMSNCENMSFMFWYSNTSRNNYTENNVTTPNTCLKELDLSDWEISNVKRMDYFFYQTMIEDLNVSGFDFSGVKNNVVTVAKNGNKYPTEGIADKVDEDGNFIGAVRDVRYFVYGGNKGLTNSINVDNVNLSEIEYLRYFISNTMLPVINVSKVQGPKHAYGCEYLFQNNTQLTTLILGDETHDFEIGTEPTYMGVPRYGQDNPYTTAIESDNNPVRSQSVWLGEMLAGCTSLKSVDLEHLKINLEEYIYQMNSVFKNCSSLEKILNLDKLCFKSLGNGAWITRNMFQGCTKLEKIDMGSYKGLIGGPYVFNGCESLKELNLANMGTALYGTGTWNNYWLPRRGFSSYDTQSPYSTSAVKKNNIFEGCTELSMVTLGDYYVQDGVAYNSNPAFTAYDALTYWGKQDNSSYIISGEAVPDIPPVGDDVDWIKIADLDEGYTYRKADPGNLDPIGKTRTTYDLFAQFKPEYAGTWVRMSKIKLDANGGTPRTQSISGSVGLPVDYEPTEIQTPQKVGYEFGGWFAEDSEGNEHNLADQFAANKDADPDNDQTYTDWTYKAKWNEHHYTLKLNGNGGTTSIEGKNVTEYNSDNTQAVEYIVNDNLGYDDFFELNNKMFTKDGYVLSSWNTRSNGEGEKYTANEAVNKLTSADGGEAILYAQWHKPDVTIKFDSAGGSAVSDRYYTLKTGTTYYGELPESVRENYTFLGWYTDDNKRVVNKTEGLGENEINEVSESCTLHARWQEDPTITFDANGYDNETPPNAIAYFDNDTTKHTLSKRYKYEQTLGVLPTPKYQSAVLKGWYTAKTGGDEINSATIATGNTTYYAHWGYRPQFDTDGGNYTNFPAALNEVQENNSQYTIATLPTVEKPNYTFNGWYYGDTRLSDGATIDLANGSVIRANWTRDEICVVTLNADGGQLGTGRKNTINVYKGSKVGELPTPKKANCDFLGWYADVNNESTKYTYETIINSNVTLTAKWANNQAYTVTFDVKHPDAKLYDSADATIKVRDGGRITDLPGANLTVNQINYLLDGWYTKPDGTGEKLTAATPITSDVTYYAKWSTTEDRYESAADNLYKYAVKWGNRSNDYVTNIDDKLIFAPANGGNSITGMLFVRFDYTVPNNDQALEPWTVKILVPKHIFKNSVQLGSIGIGTDNIRAGLEKYEDVNSDTVNSAFVYLDNDPDYYVITNNEQIIGSKTQDFTLEYTISSSQLRSMDGGYTDENGEFAGNFYNENVNVRILVDRNKNGDYTDVNDTDFTKTLGVEVHTDVKPSASKVQSAASFGWNDAWGERPSDYDQYYYITWSLYSDNDASSSQLFKISWDEGTVHDGTVIYTKEDDKQFDNTGNEKWLESGRYRTTVVTKHLRKSGDSGWQSIPNEAIMTIESVSGHKQQFRASGTAGIYLTDEGPLVYEKYIKDYYRNADRFKNGAQDKILAHSPVTNLPFEITYCENENTSNPTWDDETKTYSTPTRNYVFSDGGKNSGDIVLSSVKGTDRYTWGSSTEEALSDGDYSFNSLKVYLTEFDAVQVKSTVGGEEITGWSEPYVHKSTINNNPFVDYTDIEIWTRAEGDSEFTLLKIIKNSDLREETDDTLTDKYDETSEFGVAYANVTLPDHTVGYQIRHKSEFFTSKFFIVADMQLNASSRVYSHVREDVSSENNSLIKNNCNLTINNNEPVATKETKSGGGSICSYELSIGNSYICADKRIQSAKGNDGKYGVTVRSNYQEFPALISGWGYTDTEGSLKLIESGEFNDLLPYNFTVDKDSVYVVPITHNLDGNTNISIPDRDNPNNTKTVKGTIGNYVAVYQYNNNYFKSIAFSPAYYSVKFTEDWKGSGRTMMTIKVNTPDDAENVAGYFVFYKMKTTTANISANSTTQTNYVSFTDTTVNQSPPVSKTAKISTFDNSVAKVYTNLDGKYTAFASATTDMEKTSQTATGVNSVVKSEGEFVSKDVTVGLDSDYTYNVTFQNNNIASNIVIYDVLVNSLSGRQCDWNGKLNSVDISSLKSRELTNATDSTNTILMAPKVYYCVKNGDLVESDLDIESNRSIWKTQDQLSDEDKENIKAIAVDCSKDENGGDYVLAANKPITFNINMHSPKESDSNDIYTYNEAYAKGIANSEPFTNTTLTSVLLHYATPEFHKSAFPESGEDDEHRSGVVNKSVINYNLEITNPDDTVSINNVVIEDLLDSNLTINNMPKVKIGDEGAIAINKAPIISSYEISEDSGNNNRTKFTATISSIAPGETITVIVPATVNAALDTKIDNTASITTYNGLSSDIKSDTTYHYVTVTQAKIKKVNSKGEGLEGATLQIYENNSTNWNASTGKIKDGATPKAVTINGKSVTTFKSTDDVLIFSLEPGEYILHETNDDDNDPVKNKGYKLADDIPFTIDVEGITHVDGKAVNYVEMVDEPAYKIIFLENKPDGSIEDKNKVFRIYEPGDLTDSKIEHFYDIPEWAEDEYVFAGWYHSSTYESYANAGHITQYVTTASSFENDTFTGANTVDNDLRNDDYYLYAKWIPVGTVQKDSGDANLMEGDYRGFGLAGVQIRNPEMHDSNYETVTPGGMRFVTSLKESLLTEIDNLSSQKVETAEGNVDVEYGYAVGTEENIKAFTSHYGIAEPTKYQLQYKGKNVNGINTSGEERDGKDFTKDFRFITNVNCTRGTTNSNGTIKEDHRNFKQYRLYTLVVTYEGEDASAKNKKVDARAYIRYYDANGKLRVFYNTYKKSMYGGCLCSFNQVAAMAIPQNQEMLDEQQKNP